MQSNNLALVSRSVDLKPEVFLDDNLGIVDEQAGLLVNVKLKRNCHRSRSVRDSTCTRFADRNRMHRNPVGTTVVLYVTNANCCSGNCTAGFPVYDSKHTRLTGVSDAACNRATSD